MTTKEAVLRVQKLYPELSNRQLAASLGVHPIMVTHYKRGKYNMRPELADKFAAIFGITITEEKSEQKV